MSDPAAERYAQMIRDASTRADAAWVYACAMRHKVAGLDKDKAYAALADSDFWRPIGLAIREKWSNAGLVWIKREAWRMVEVASA